MREEHPGCGVEKMYYTLSPDFIGRDEFIRVFMSLGYRVKRVKNYVRTTVASHLKLPNLIEGMELTRPNQLWQSDITYFYLNGDFYYLTFIIDVYTRKIIGYKASRNMQKEANIFALKQALSQYDPSQGGLIHHSDRGSQYGSNAYLNLLSKNNITPSMGVKGQDNAYAERLNGIIKNEYLRKWEIKDYKDLQVKLKKSVNHYNIKRIHRSLPNRNSPVKFEELVINLKYQERPKVIIYAEGKPNYIEVKYLDIINQEIALAHNCPMV